MKKLKANFVVGKKQIILAALVVLLGGAVYVNYLYANSDGDYLTTGALNTASQDQSLPDSGKNYGDAQLVNGEVSDPSDYFQKASLERTRSRDQAIETVRSVLENVDAEADELAEASAKIVQLTQQIEDENKIENLIKAKGFNECVVYLDDESVNVIVETSGLAVEEAAQIKNIVLSQRDVKAENITIQEVESGKQAEEPDTGNSDDNTEQE